MKVCENVPLAAVAVMVSANNVPVGALKLFAVAVALVFVQEALSNVSDCKIRFVLAVSINRPLKAKVIGLYCSRRTLVAAVCSSPLDPKNVPLEALAKEPVDAIVLGLITFIQ